MTSVVYKKVEMSCIACGKSHVLDTCGHEFHEKHIEGENKAFGKRKVLLCLLPVNEQEPQCQKLHSEINMQNFHGESSNWNA